MSDPSYADCYIILARWDGTDATEFLGAYSSDRLATEAARAIWQQQFGADAELPPVHVSHDGRRLHWGHRYDCVTAFRPVLDP